jgi:hypothetical protein
MTFVKQRIFINDVHSLSYFRISTVQVPFDLLVTPLQVLLVFPPTLRLAVHGLIVFAFPRNSFLFLSSPPLVLFFLDRIKDLPHLANLSSDIRDLVARELVLDLGVDVLPIEEKGAHRLLRRLWFVEVFSSAHF